MIKYLLALKAFEEVVCKETFTKEKLKEARKEFIKAYLEVK